MTMTMTLTVSENAICYLLAQMLLGGGGSQEVSQLSILQIQSTHRASFQQKLNPAKRQV